MGIEKNETLQRYYARSNKMAKHHKSSFRSNDKESEQSPSNLVGQRVPTMIKFHQKLKQIEEERNKGGRDVF